MQADDLTPSQRGLCDAVLARAGQDGSDTRDVLWEARAYYPAGEVAAVAEALGGPGAGAEFLVTPAEPATAAQNDADEF